MGDRPRLLDLFCGAGGCSVGYHRAGFEVVGVDLHPQKQYPFTFVQGDALEYLAVHGREYDAVHASPPCQKFSIGRHIHQSGDRHLDLVAPVRWLLERSQVPWVIENVVGAPLVNPITLCGRMFGLKVLRHRLFESSTMLMQPGHPRHPRGNLTNSNQGYSRGDNGFVCVAGHNFEREAGAAAMGIDWMTNRHQIAQAIPPAYTEFVGKQLMAHLEYGNAADL